ncbi:hypothetical protein F0P96_19635 [Hymenobacter busanensis]|uniref:Uncharacterized protein n=1 Tax=Hymenobacter busanensis TaxID=2607656 RepID=A0A7L4ZWE0_9BACT|nr:DUF5602 domain-containing protein [Hymenobacter busanensis]KAA9325545.1 hypothetical protein F0P96_19635 [Hymenobacter busanensis]QHJ07784.1 hypothetical protein GUY19_11030 [Hymenobacter busanensis]
MMTSSSASAVFIRRSAGVLLAGLLALALASCDDDDNPAEPQTKTYFGDTVTMGNGSARSFVTLDKNGVPTEVGARMTEAALTGLPTTDPVPPTPPTWFRLPLPAEAAKTAYDHVSVDWNPNGHEPAGVYTSAHFDVHFYMMTLAQRQQIQLNDPKGEILPEARFLPSGYISPPGPVNTIPMMGRHWVDPTGHEFHGQAFTQTFIYGSYDGKINFMEPMIAKTTLAAKTTQTFEVQQPQAFQLTGRYYPTKYTIAFDQQAKEHVVVLHDMVLR